MKKRIIVSSAIFIAFLSLIFVANKPASVKSQEVDSESIITEEIKTCLTFPSNLRSACAEKVGKRVAELFNTPKTKMRQCMKLRTFFLLRECQKGAFPK